MTRPGFLLLNLALQLLHLAEASTCQGDNCPTGDYYLELNLYQFNVVCILCPFPITGLIISGGMKTETSIETFPADANCNIPPFPAPGNLSPFSPFSPFYSPPKGDITTPSLSSRMSLWHAAGSTMATGLHVSLGAVAKMDGLTTQPWGLIRYLITLTFILIPSPVKGGVGMQLWRCKTKRSSSSAASAARSLVKL